MNKKNLLFLICLAAGSLLQAQTWNGSSSTDWNTTANWSTNTVPGTGSTVTIPNTVNKPVLADNVTVTGFNMSAGSALDFNGFTLTVSGNLDISGATLNNSNGATDIVISITSAGGAGSNYFGSSTINDNITLNYNGTGTSYEGYTSGNTFNGNVIFNLGGTGAFNSSYHQKSTFNGNLTVNRTVAGSTDLFHSGFNAITGNLSYTNNAGGDNFINSNNVSSGVVGGTINITTSGAGNPDFYLRKIKNLTTGGTISVQNSGRVFIDNDTLLLAALNVNGFTGGGSDELRKNVITGNITFSEDAVNTGSVYIGENIINGNTSFTSNAAHAWYEGYTGGDTFNGNTGFNLGGTGAFNSSYHQKSTFNGNLTVNRTVSGITDLFHAGFNAITGNLSYTNNAGGDNFINSNNVSSGVVGGTVNITTSGAGNPDFYLRKIKNLTTGGTISVQNSGRVFIDDDTLLLTALNVNGFTGSGADELRRNVITGNITFSEDAANTGSVYIGENSINGNASFTSNATHAWYESYTGSDIYNGNVDFSRSAASGTFNIAYNDTTYVKQNLVFNSTSGFDINSSIEFGGSANASIEQTGIQPISMPRLIMNKTGGASLTLNDSVTVSVTTSFISGNIISSANKHLIFPNNASHTGASVSSHVAGPVSKIGDDAFTFPVGTLTSLNTAAMTAPAGATSKFSAQYFKTNPSLAGYDTSQHAGTLQRISGCEYWDIQRLNGASNVTLTFSFAAPCAGSTGYISNPAAARITRWTGGPTPAWENLGNGGSTGTTTGTITTAAAVTNFSPFTFASADVLLNPLPVTLLNFAASKCNNGICLLWVTENEQSFSHFETEKSADGRNFATLNSITARNTAGRNSYTSTDNNPANGDNFYRLKITDLDGSFKYSKVININLSRPLQVSLLPNPANNFILLNGVKDYKLVRIFDFAGKVKQQQSIRNSIEEINISRLPAGIYIVQLSGDKETTTIKLIKQ